jgi:hypothetical protein
MKVLSDIQGFLLNKWTMGGSLLIVGVATLNGNLFGDTLNMVWFSVPVLGDITLLRIMGLLVLLLGVAVLTDGKFDPLDVQEEV